MNYINNISNVEYTIIENIKRVKYENVYYLNNQFYYFTIKNNNIILKNVYLLGGANPGANLSDDDFILKPIIKNFNTEEELINFINSHESINVTGITNYFSHFFDHNIAHGLYDALYPSFLTLLTYYNEYNSYNNLLNLLFIPGWKFPGHASRDWTLNIFKTFSKGNILIKSNFKNNILYKFDIIIAGSGKAGISSVNFKAQMPGKEINALEKFRDRMIEVHNVSLIKSEKLIIRIIHSKRYSFIENQNLELVNKKLNSNGYDCEIINWENIKNFKEQLEIIYNTNIHISGAGSSMLNFPFLKNNSIHINLGVNPMHPCMNPGLFEVNICLLSNKIYCDYYDIFTHKKINYDLVINIIQKHINNIKNNISNELIIPNYIKIWREYCIEDKINMKKIVKQMMKLKEPSLVSYRHPEILVLEYYPYNKESNLINNNLLKNIKMKYSNFI